MPDLIRQLAHSRFVRPTVLTNLSAASVLCVSITIASERVQAAPATTIQSHARKSVENNRVISLSFGIFSFSLTRNKRERKVQINYLFIFSSLKIKEEKTKQKRRNFDCLRCSYEHRFKWMLRVNPHSAPR